MLPKLNPMAKITTIALFFFLVPALAFGQAVRVDQSLLAPGPNVPISGSPLPQALLLANSTVQVCAHPATVNTCTPVQTYGNSAETIVCPLTAQLTAQGGSTCRSTVGIAADVGFWYAGGTVDYIVSNSTYGTLGPYSVSSGGGGTFSLTLTTNDSSGVATLSAGSNPTLNIPNYSAAAVSAFNGRTGSVIPTGGDYSIPDINGGIAGANALQASNPAGTAMQLATFPQAASLFAGAGVTYATTALNWSQTIGSGAQNLTAGTPATVTLTSCPVGIDTTTGLYQVYLSDANSEVVGNPLAPIGGTCTSGASSGTITFTPFFSHTAYTIGSASSGVLETVNQACGTNATTWKNQHCSVTLPSNGGPTTGSNHPLNTYNIYGTLFLHANHSHLTGYGVSLNCLGRAACLQTGDLLSSNDYTDITVEGLSFREQGSNGSVLVTNTVANGSYKTITTASAHNFRPGDMVTIRFTDDVQYWGDGVITDCGSGSSAAACDGSSTTFRMATSRTIATQATPGVVALTYSAVLDNAGNSTFRNLSLDGSYSGTLNRFNLGFDLWDDENALIDKFNNSAVALNYGSSWSGAFVFSGGAQNRVGSGFDQTSAPVITVRDSTITANRSEGVSVYDDNGVYIENTVIQASGLWQVHTSTETSGVGAGAHLKNIYGESSVAENSCSGATTPFPCTGIAGWIMGAGGGLGEGFELQGRNMIGAYQTGGSGSTVYSYFVVANDTTASAHTNPMPILTWSSTGSDAPLVQWPRVANAADVMTYDVLRCTGIGVSIGSVGTIYSAPGGSAAACGSVATGLTQSSACTVNGGLVCTFTDSGAASTSAYTINGGSYYGPLHFWPGSVVSVGHSFTANPEQSDVVAVTGTGAIEQTNTCDANSAGWASAGGGFTSCLGAIHMQSGTSNMTATLMADNYGPGAQNTAVTGRLNFPSQPGGAWQAHQIITLMDSNPLLTTSTIGYRRPASVNDAWIGTDSPHNTALTTTMLAIGAGQSITQYIANIGSSGTYPYGGTGWLERLTSKQKTFAVPVRISDGNSFTLGNGSPLSQMKIYRVNIMPVSHVPPQSCVDVVGEAKGLTKSDQITSITPPGRLGNLFLNAYPGDEDAIILHFCNPSGSEAITPPGAYSFLAVR